MRNGARVKNIIRTMVLLGVLVFFVVVAALQIYEIAGINNQANRIVLGVNGTGDEGFQSALKAKPVVMGNLVGIVSGGNFTVVDKNANTQTTENFMLTDPVLHAKGNYSIVADYGGRRARLYEKGEVIREIETKGNIISVVTNAGGFFAIAQEAEGYNAAITVYRKNGEAIYRYSIAKNTFVDMDISSNNREMIIVEANLSSGTLGSNVVLVDFGSELAKKDYYVKSVLYVGVHFNKNGTFLALSGKKADLYSHECVKMGEISFNDRELIASDITTDDMTTFVFPNSEATKDGYVVEIYDRNGEMRASSEFSTKPSHICVNGKYVSVAHGDGVDILKNNGKIKKSWATPTAVKFAAPFANGKTAVVFSGGNTSIMK